MRAFTLPSAFSPTCSPASRSPASSSSSSSEVSGSSISQPGTTSPSSTNPTNHLPASVSLCSSRTNAVPRGEVHSIPSALAQSLRISRSFDIVVPSGGGFGCGRDKCSSGARRSVAVSAEMGLVDSVGSGSSGGVSRTARTDFHVQLASDARVPASRRVSSLMGSQGR